MVRDVFDNSKLENLKGYMGVGHGKSFCLAVPQCFRAYEIFPLL